MGAYHFRLSLFVFDEVAENADLEVVTEQSILRLGLAYGIVFGITQCFEVGIVSLFQRRKLFSVFQGLLILAPRKRFRDGDIVLAVSLTGLGFGNIIFPVTGLNNYGDFISGPDLIRVQRCPEKIPICFLSLSSVAKIGPCAIRLLQKTVIQLINRFGNGWNILRIRTSGVKLKVCIGFYAAVFPKICIVQNLEEIRYVCVKRVFRFRWIGFSAPSENDSVIFMI